METGPKSGLKGVAGFAVGELRDNGPKGTIEFVHCVAENTAKESVRLYDKSATSARVRLVNCSFRRPWQLASDTKAAAQTPILLQSRHAEDTTKPGGIDFEDCYVYDSGNRSAMVFEAAGTGLGLRDVHGQIVVEDSAAPTMHLGTNLEDVDLKVMSAEAGTTR